MDVKFTQLYYFVSTLHALDEDGHVWYFHIEKNTWMEMPHAVRNTPVKTGTGGIVTPLTPKEIQDKAFKQAQDSVTSEIKEYEH